MKNSWLFKLIISFLIIILIGGSITAVITSRATLTAFTLYTTRNGKIWADRLAPGLVEYYSRSKSWIGVETWLQDNYFVKISTESTDGMMMGPGGGQGQGHGPGSGRIDSDNSMMGALGQRLILADENGLIIYDSFFELSGIQLTQTEITNGTPIVYQSNQVGTLLITPGGTGAGETPADEFQSSVYRAVITSAIVAILIALLLGSLLFIQITAPLRKLRQAAAAISDGDLTHRVDIKGADEFADLGTTFNTMAESLSRSELQRQQLMADVAHELRTPLTAIQGTIEGMQDEVLPMDKDQLDALYAETTLLNRLIDDLRILSLAENNQLKLNPQPTDINALIKNIIDRAQSQAQLKNVLIEDQLEDNLPEIPIDADRFTQIMNNLINNAMRYTPKGGSIKIYTRQSKPGSIIQISVSDSGTGITLEDLPHVFDRFYRADKSRTRASGGSGLGLAIVKGLVEAHGGKVRVESPILFTDDQKGNGTRFIIELPIKK